jgi:hypothetical protein
MRYLVLFILLSSSAAFAKSTRGPRGFVLSIGPSAVSSYDSDRDAINGRKIIKADGSIGYNFGAEIPIISSTLTLNILGMYSKRDAITQYYDRINSIQADDQKSYISKSEALFGLRFRPLSLGFFKIFVGGGGLVGNALGMTPKITSKITEHFRPTSKMSKRFRNGDITSRAGPKSPLRKIMQYVSWGSFSIHRQKDSRH